MQTIHLISGIVLKHIGNSKLKVLAKKTLSFHSDVALGYTYACVYDAFYWHMVIWVWYLKLSFNFFASFHSIISHDRRATDWRQFNKWIVCSDITYECYEHNGDYVRFDLWRDRKKEYAHCQLLPKRLGNRWISVTKTYCIRLNFKSCILSLFAVCAFVWCCYFYFSLFTPKCDWINRRNAFLFYIVALFPLSLVIGAYRWVFVNSLKMMPNFSGSFNFPSVQKFRNLNNECKKRFFFFKKVIYIIQNHAVTFFSSKEAILMRKYLWPTEQ